MGTFASNTDVPAEASRMEIERTLMRYGASSFGYIWDQEQAEVAFEAKGKPWL